MTEANNSSNENRLLAALPPDEADLLTPHLEFIHLDLKYTLYEPNKPISHVYFPLNGVVSLVTIMADGAIAEVATVGNEGMAGLPVYLGAGMMSGSAFCQVPGDALRIESGIFREELDKGSSLHHLLHLYTQALFTQISQSAACNRLHSLEERCARWLLMTHDRVGADKFLLTQEFLSQMLGTRRASVSIAAGMLKKAGLIQYVRGQITVLDRPGLEEASCECYRVIEQEFDRLIP